MHHHSGPGRYPGMSVQLNYFRVIRRSITWLGLVVVALASSACSSLPQPTPGGFPVGMSSQANPAKSILARSAAVQGDAWGQQLPVTVGFEGKWTNLITKIQPVLTDSSFRQTSVENYLPSARRVVQYHQGPAGTKMVRHQRQGQTLVYYNKKPASDQEVIASAALVADAYTLFVYGSGWLQANTTAMGTLPARALHGEQCDLVVCQVAPGFGPSKVDQVIAWIGQETKLLRRVQFSLDALESTRGADVDVVFSSFRRTADGGIWPTQFLEYVRRPFVFRAHEWTLTSLAVNGKRVRWQDLIFP